MFTVTTIWSPSSRRVAHLDAEFNTSVKQKRGAKTITITVKDKLMGIMNDDKAIGIQMHDSKGVLLHSYGDVRTDKKKKEEAITNV